MVPRKDMIIPWIELVSKNEVLWKLERKQRILSERDNSIFGTHKEETVLEEMNTQRTQRNQEKH